MVSNVESVKIVNNFFILSPLSQCSGLASLDDLEDRTLLGSKNLARGYEPNSNIVLSSEHGDIRFGDAKKLGRPHLASSGVLEGLGEQELAQ